MTKVQLGFLLFAILIIVIASQAFKQSPQVNKTYTETRVVMEKSETEWKKQLTSEEYEVLRNHGTERAFSGEYTHNKDSGTYNCKACDAPLFSSTTKFDSGTGWPSFEEAIPGSIGTKQDERYGMNRTEVHCKNCGSHLGHVFNDGPGDSGLRYCINSICLDFDKTNEVSGN